MDETPAHDAASDRWLPVALVTLGFGHMLSTMLRTIPAISLDVMAADFHTSAQALASEISIYHFAFAASQIPVGAALDRFGVRPVSLSLLLGTFAGAILSGLSTGSTSFLFSQLMIGVSTSGMLMCPMTLAAKRLTARRFGLWSGVILSVGNMGMLLSSSPLAFVVEHYGWRMAFWLAASFSLVVATAVFALVPREKASPAAPRSPIVEMVGVLRIGVSRPLRGIIAMSLVSLASSLVLRGLWGGPWLMEIKGLSRIEAGQELGLFTLTLIAGPALIGLVDRRIGHRRELIAISHVIAAILLALMAAGAPGFLVSQAVGMTVMPALYDRTLLLMIGIVVSTQPLIYGMARQIVDVANVGKALAAVNLAFFLGTALLQSMTGLIAVAWGLPAVLIFMAAALIVGVLVFLAYT
jgi:predicted MFS family arabinose efflux permease